MALVIRAPYPDAPPPAGNTVTYQGTNVTYQGANVTYGS